MRCKRLRRAPRAQHPKQFESKNEQLVETKAGIDALTFHGGDIVPGLLEVVLRIALALQDGGLGDGVQPDVVVGPVRCHQ